MQDLQRQAPYMDGKCLFAPEFIDNNNVLITSLEGNHASDQKKVLPKFMHKIKDDFSHSLAYAKRGLHEDLPKTVLNGPFHGPNLELREFKKMEAAELGRINRRKLDINSHLHKNKSATRPEDPKLSQSTNPRLSPLQN